MDKTCDYDTPAIRILYKAGLILLVPVIAFFTAAHISFVRDFLLNGNLSCSILKLTGVPCLSCGMTRAAFSLSELNISASIRYNAGVFFGILFYIIFMVVEMLHFRHNRRGFSETGFFIMFYTWLAVVVVHWIIKITALYM